jgi:hypothetical protein
VALPAAAAVLMLSGGDVLVAHGRAELASRIPGNNVMPAAAILPTARQNSDTGRYRELAMEALRSAPLTGEALTWLAIDAAGQAHAARAERLLALSGRTGWRGEWTQRNLYNAALLRGDAPAAIRHADALLRQGQASDELFGRIVQGMSVPAFRSAFPRALAATPKWGGQFLARRGAQLDDEALLQAASAWAKPHESLNRDVAAPLMSRLVAAGRVKTAAAVWAMVPDGAHPGPGTLEWPDALARNAPTPFDWNLPAGFAIEEGANPELVAASAVPGEFARRILWLEPGNYRIAASPADEWLWAAGCSPRPAMPNRPFTPDASFAVPPGCAGTVLSVAPAPGRQSARLGRVSIEPLP